MKFAICNEMFQDWTFEEVCRFSSGLGYTGLEIAPFTLAQDVYAITPAMRQATRQAAKEAGLEIIGLHWLLAKTEGYYLTSVDAEVLEKTSDYFAELARCCRDMGGSIMVLGSPQQRNLLPGVTHDQAMQLAADCIGAAMPVLEECGVTLALEPLAPAETDFLTTAEKTIELVEMIGSPNCRLHLDVKAMAGEAKEAPRIIRESGPYVVHFHANDPNLRGPGMGETDFGPIFEALVDIDYQGWVSVEVFDYEPGAETLARESIRYMKQFS